MQDILTALEYLRSRSKASEVNLIGLEIAGVWSYFARTMAGDGVNLAADLVQFAADTDSEYMNKFFIPGLRKAGDFRAAAVLNAQGRTLVYNAGPQFPSDWARQVAATRPHLVRRRHSLRSRDRRARSARRGLQRAGDRRGAGHGARRCARRAVCHRAGWHSRRGGLAGRPAHGRALRERVIYCQHAWERLP